MTEPRKKKVYRAPAVATRQVAEASVLLGCTGQIDCLGDGTCCAPDPDSCSGC